MLIILFSLLASRGIEASEIDPAYCESLPTGYYEYPQDCNGYISCNSIHTELEYCPNDKLFNTLFNICDTPEAVICNPMEVTTIQPKTDVCKDLPNNFLLPNQTSDCKQFIECLNGEAVIHECPGDLIFHPLWRICDEPDDVLCPDDKPQDMFTLCLGQKLGTSFPYIEDCRQYYYCFGNGSYAILPCPLNNWYDPFTGNCGPEVSAEACRQDLTSTWTSTRQDNPCLDEELGASFPLASNCQEYILCLGNGQTVLGKCPVNSWFDPQLGDCGPNVSPTACRDSVETTTLSPNEMCVDQTKGTSLAYVTDCQKYILCMDNGVGQIVPCINNAWFDPQTGICGPNVSPTACKEESASTQTTQNTSPLSTQTTTEATTTMEPPIDWGICSSAGNKSYVAYPDNCKKYIVCVEPVPIAFYCPTHYYFSENLQQCVDWADSDCPLTETTTFSPVYTTPLPTPTMCTNNAQSKLPYPDNCQWFIYCVNDYVYMMGVCPNEEYYDPTTEECGANVSPEACREVFTTSSVESPPSSTPSPQLNPCQGVESGKLVPYPYDCTKFIECIEPEPQVYDCVEGQEFSARLERCMAPWFANCSISATTTEFPFPATTTTAEPLGLCAGEMEGSLIPYPTNCSKYIACQEPIPVGYECPNKEEFSPLELCCMDAQLAGCTIIF